MKNPYSDIRDYQRWRRGVSRVEPHLLDLVTNPKFQIAPETRVCTAGSCFAQHISRKIADIGFNYHVTEDGRDLPETERLRRNYGVFSARFGNLYTVAQLVQLFDEAFGFEVFEDPAWQREDGRWVDPFRPQIEPDGFASPDDVAHARAEHLACVTRMFREAELFIFTLGLTEAWRSRRTGRTFPLAPGVAGGTYEPHLYEFHNHSVLSVVDGLRTFLDKLKSVNPGVKVLLTVSPVPLIATHEDRHVLVSTVHSKSVLRAAVSEVVSHNDWVDYFPSYEIITGPSTGGLYFEDDHRQVKSLGVAHAMRMFTDHYVQGAARPRTDVAIRPGPASRHFTQGTEIVCDEEALDDGS